MPEGIIADAVSVTYQAVRFDGINAGAISVTSRAAGLRGLTQALYQ